MQNHPHYHFCKNVKQQGNNNKRDREKKRETLLSHTLITLLGTALFIFPAILLDRLAIALSS